jgi:Pentapeptide repeats (8 copies)
MYSLVTGAAATGVNRSTILRAIKAGKLSAERDGHRLFPPLPQLPAVVEPVQSGGNDTEVATITDLRADRDHWREVHQSGADLCRAGLHGADLHRAGLHGADLHRADLHTAVLYEAEPPPGGPQPGVPPICRPGEHRPHRR